MLSRAVVGACISVLAFLAGVRALDRAAVSDHILQALEAPETTFRRWVSDYNKPYAEGSEEYTRRFHTWKENVDFVRQYNQQHHSHWLGLNSFADMSFDQFQEYPRGYDYQAQLRLEQQKATSGIISAFRYEDVPDLSLPNEINWVEKGAVTEVKNQAQCGSCWAFSTTGSIEGINFIKTGTLEVLSEQELVDCDHAQDNGCMGGLMDYAFQFVIENGGLDTEKDYAYTAQNGVCNVKKEHRHVVTIDAYEDVPRMSQNALLKAVAHQPVSVAIQANERAFQLYAGGVLTDDCGTALDHGVLLVGYGRENNTDYWLIKNSWGALWGEQGYIKLERTAEPGPGKCGIAMLPSYPVKEHDNPPRPPRPSPDPPTPPGPAPNQPVKCDAYTQCMPRTTCCCMNELLGMCLQWACCPMPQATCCDDRRHCCPQNLPVCDVANSRCLPKGAAFDDPRGVSLLTKIPAARFGRGADAIRVG